MCRNNLKIQSHQELSERCEVCLFNRIFKRNYTWHSIEVQYEGCHEGGLDGEDGDDEGEDQPIGEVKADDQERGQEGIVGKSAEKGAKIKEKKTWCFPI